jgi:predicted transcriptional regulator
MLERNADFLRPSPKHHTLGILQALSVEPGVSQCRLGRKAGLSSGRINGYLKQLRDQGLLTVNPLNAKKYEYLVTEAGERARREMLGEYCAEVVRSYAALKDMVGERLTGLAARGVRNVALFGASATGEIVYQAMEPMPLRVMAVVDSDPAKQGAVFGNCVVLPPPVLVDIGCEAVVISSFGKSDEIFKTLASIIDVDAIPVVRL